MDPRVGLERGGLLSIDDSVRTIKLEHDSTGAPVVRLKNLRDRTETVLPPTQARKGFIDAEHN